MCMQAKMHGSVHADAVHDHELLVFRRALAHQKGSGCPVWLDLIVQLCYVSMILGSLGIVKHIKVPPKGTLLVSASAPGN